MSNRRSILFLLAGIVLLVAMHFAVTCSSGGLVDRPRTTLLEPLDHVVQIDIAQRGTAHVVLAYTNGAWMLTAPFCGRADEQVAKRLLDVLFFTPVVDSFSDAELLKMGRERSDFSLGEATLSVTVYGEVGPQTVAFGAAAPAAGGVYASVSGVDAVFIAAPEVMAAANLTADSFRLRRLFSADPATVVAFDVKRGGARAMSFERDGDGWKTSEGQVSAAKVAKFLSGLSAAEATGFVWPKGGSNETAVASASLLAGYGLDPESSVTVTLKSVDGSNSQVSFGRDAGDGVVYALAQNGAAVVTVASSLKDSATRETARFADSRLFPAEAGGVKSFTVVDGDVSYSLVRAADGGWRLDSPVSAPASKAVADDMLARILALSPSDVDASGVSVSLSTESKPISVSRRAVLGDARFEDLRSREVAKIDPAIAKRLVSTSTNGTVSVVYVRDRSEWNVETEDVRGTVDTKAVASILSALNPMEALRVVKLKVSASDLAVYGLDRPFLTLAVDQDRENAVRRNIIVGAETEGGRYATVGSSDAVFVLPAETVMRLGRPLVAE